MVVGVIFLLFSVDVFAFVEGGGYYVFAFASKLLVKSRNRSLSRGLVKH
jgi:hypothetical protein